MILTEHYDLSLYCLSAGFTLNVNIIYQMHIIPCWRGHKLFLLSWLIKRHFFILFSKSSYITEKGKRNPSQASAIHIYTDQTEAVWSHISAFKYQSGTAGPAEWHQHCGFLALTHTSLFHARCAPHQLVCLKEYSVPLLPTNLLSLCWVHHSDLLFSAYWTDTVNGALDF